MANFTLTLLLLVLLGGLIRCQNDVRKPPNIIEPNSPKVFHYSSNSKVELKCKAEGIPTPTYSWMRNRVPVVVDNYISFDSVTGSLEIPDFTKREEGTYMCIASNVFDSVGGRITASSFAPPIKIYQTRVGKFIEGSELRQQVTEYEYALLKCDNKGEVVGADININWYESEKSKDVSMDGGRLFIDQNGNLHFSYVLAKDATTNFIYLCGVSSTSERLILLGNSNYLTVIPVQNPTAIKPQLRHSNSGVKGLRYGKVKLECVFSGYDPSPPHLPSVHWYDDAGNEITQNTDRYTLSEDKRALTINGLLEEHEKNYFCQAENSAGKSDKVPVFLNVTSAPIFVNAPKDQTVVENVDAEFHCDARSASNEVNPDSPSWYINGIKMGQHTDPTKFHLINGNKTLVIKKVKKASDILCVQCEVVNEIDTVWGDACLNVILPIKIEKRPPETQLIDHGDVVDLTVTASTDPSMTLSYRWEFNNMSYLGNDLPPFMFYDPTTMLAYINTSQLTEDQYDTIGGTYTRVFYHAYQTEKVVTVVTLKDKPVIAPAAAASVDMWIIGLIIGILFLLIVIIIIIFVICRKKQEGDYNVDKKEVGAGLDPERELKDKGFNDYSRPDYDSDYDGFPSDKKPRPDLEYDDVPIGGDDESLGEYGEEDDTHFNEDGSFIGIYQKKQQPSSKAHESTI